MSFLYQHSLVDCVHFLCNRADKPDCYLLSSCAGRNRNLPRRFLPQHRCIMQLIIIAQLLQEVFYFQWNTWVFRWAWMAIGERKMSVWSFGKEKKTGREKSGKRISLPSDEKFWVIYAALFIPENTFSFSIQKFACVLWRWLNSSLLDKIITG